MHKPQLPNPQRKALGSKTQSRGRPSVHLLRDVERGDVGKVLDVPAALRPDVVAVADVERGDAGKVLDVPAALRPDVASVADVEQGNVGKVLDVPVIAGGGLPPHAGAALPMPPLFQAIHKVVAMSAARCDGYRLPDGHPEDTHLER